MRTFILILLLGFSSAVLASHHHHGGYYDQRHHHHHRGFVGIYFGPTYSPPYFVEERPYYYVYDRHGRIIRVVPNPNYYYEEW